MLEVGKELLFRLEITQRKSLDAGPLVLITPHHRNFNQWRPCCGPELLSHVVLSKHSRNRFTKSELIKNLTSS